MANPEVHLPWSVARGAAAELGFELRAYLPIETNSSFGILFGLPVILRADSLRLDTGVYVPIDLQRSAPTLVSIPFHLWIQATRTLWLGPSSTCSSTAGTAVRRPFPLGFGLGSAINPGVDLRAWFLFPDITGTKARAISAPASPCSSASGERPARAGGHLAGAR